MPLTTQHRPGPECLPKRMPSCMVKGCTFSWRTREPQTVLHVFPRQRERILNWLQMIRMDESHISSLVEKMYNSRNNEYRICSLHFSKLDYEQRGKKMYLKKNAVPSQNLPPPNLHVSKELEEHSYFRNTRVNAVPESETSQSASNNFENQCIQNITNFSNPQSDYFPICESMSRSKVSSKCATQCMRQTSENPQCLSTTTFESFEFGDRNYFKKLRLDNQEELECSDFVSNSTDVPFASHTSTEEYFYEKHVECIAMHMAKDDTDVVEQTVGTQVFNAEMQNSMTNTVRQKRKYKARSRKTIGINTEYYPSQKHKHTQFDKSFGLFHKSVHANIKPKTKSIGIQCDLFNLKTLKDSPTDATISQGENNMRKNDLFLNPSMCETPKQIWNPLVVVDNSTCPNLTARPALWKSPTVSQIKGCPSISPTVSPLKTYSDVQNSLQTSTSSMDHHDPSYHPIKEEEADFEKECDHFLIDEDDPDNSFMPLTENNDPNEYASEKKFIVFDSCLTQLLMSSRCKAFPTCNGLIKKIKKYMVGSAIVVTGFCSNQHKFHLWSSQPFIGGMPAGNILLSASILCSGSNFRKIKQFFTLLGVSSISKSTHYKNQSKFIFPAIDYHWQKERESVFQHLDRNVVTLAGDGQCDPPGFNAKYCTYTFLELKTNRIVDFQVERLEAGISSVALEKQAFNTVLDRILADHLNVKVIATDGHVGIRKSIKENYVGIKHQFDVWHFAKSIGNKLRRASRRKNCEKLAAWVSPAINHLWWSASTCQRDAKLLKEKWVSLAYHSANVHEWSDANIYQSCSHGPLYDSEDKHYLWLEPGSAAHQHLKAVVNDKRILKDMEHLSNFCHAGNLEVFHSMAQKYRSKRHHFQIDGMVARTQLAAMDHNHNAQRLQAIINNPTAVNDPEGTLHFKLTSSKAKKDWTVSKMYEPTDQSFLLDIMRSILKFTAGEITFTWAPRSSMVPQNIATVPRPEKASIIQKYLSSFTDYV
ncbi:uncharacterized protein [Aquarana catesbeiana]|uniref:uncharacterized protein isoform X1 n=1 Tax=Aquarana catesbeiana TaxID=8400 RepID=UPI003CC92677